MLYLVGLGLGDPTDITVKGLEIVRKCSRVYLESYTSILPSTSVEQLETFFGKSLEVADREMVEQRADDIIDTAKDEDVAFLVVGDPMGATTHTDFLLRARDKDVPTQVVHNASILNAVGITGLQLYSFGETVSIPFWTEGWRPDSFFPRICENKRRGLHTLCLLDIKVKEPNLELMTKGKVVYDPPRFMTTAEAATQIVEIIQSSSDPDSLTCDDFCVGVARVGSSSPKIVSCSLKKMCEQDLGPPLHSLVIPGQMHPLETEFLKVYMTDS